MKFSIPQATATFMIAVLAMATMLPVIQASSSYVGDVLDRTKKIHIRRHRHNGKDESDNNNDDDNDDDNNNNQKPGGDDNDNGNETVMYLKAMVTIDHVVPPISEDGTKILDWNRDVITNAIVNADSKINTNSRYHAESGFIEKYIDVLEDGRGFSCHDENDENHNNLDRAPPIMGDLYWYWMSFGCGFMCRPDDDDSFMVTEEDGGNNHNMNNGMTLMDLFLEVTTGRTPENHKVLEAELCRELRTSGESALATVTSCTIDFIYSDDNNMVHGRGEFGPSFATIPAVTTTTFSSSESSAAATAAASLTNEDMFETADMMTTALLRSEK